MEEKKLTDEEIAKAILQQVEYGAGIPYIDEWGKVRTIKFTDMLNFIHRLQRENSDLREENAILKGNPPMIVGRRNGKTIRAKLLAFDKMKEKNDELQRKVDELTNRKIEPLIVKCPSLEICPKVERAVKATAKEILQDLYNETIREGRPAVYCFLTPKEIKDRAERYGVEVE